MKRIFDFFHKKNTETERQKKSFLFKKENIKKFERILKYLKYCGGGISSEACKNCPNDGYCGMIKDVIDNWKINICGEPHNSKPSPRTGHG